MLIDHPLDRPSGFTEQSSFEMTSNAPTPLSTAFVVGDVLLFQFFTFVDDVTIQVDLVDNQGNGTFATDLITAQANDTDKFINFAGFPPRADGSLMDRCQYRITLTNTSSPNSGTSVSVKVFRTGSP